LLDWVISGAVYLLLALIIVISLAALVEGLSGSLEKAKDLAEELAGDRQQLDQRTRELDRRLVQIRTAAEISRSISAVLDPNALLQQMADLVRARFDLYYVGVFLLDERSEYAVLQAGTGDAGQQMISAGHKLPIGGASMIGWTIANRKPRIALDVGDDAVRFSNPLLPLTRSEMALPLMSGDAVFGAMSVQSARQEAFDEDDVIVLQGIADSLATALQNARLFKQEQDSLEEIRALNRQYVTQAWTKGGHGLFSSQYTFVNEQSDRSPASVASSDPNEPAVEFPLILRDQVIGRISLDMDRDALLPEDTKLIEQVTTQAALAMENVRLLEETQRRAGQERLVAEIVQKARSSTDVETILRTTLSELGRALGAEDGQIVLQTDRSSIASDTPARPVQEVEE
jgi:GAF domain-containing protein